MGEREREREREGEREIQLKNTYKTFKLPRLINGELFAFQAVVLIPMVIKFILAKTAGFFLLK